MGCIGSQRIIPTAVNPYDLESARNSHSITFDEKTTCSKLWSGKVCVSNKKTQGKQLSEKGYDNRGITGHSTDLSVMDQKKIKQMLELQSSQIQDPGAFTAEAALNRAMHNIHESLGRMEIVATRGDMNISNVYEAGYGVPGEFRISPLGNLPSGRVYDTSDPNNVNSPMINPFLGHRLSGSPIYMGKKPEIEAPTVFSGNCRHTSDKVSYSIPQHENKTSAEIPEMENGYMSSKSTETMTSKNDGSFSDFKAFRSSCPFGLECRSLSQILTGSFSDDSYNMGNQEQREGEIQTDSSENENFEHIVNEINLKLSSSSSEFDLNNVVAEMDPKHKQNFQSNELRAGVRT